MTYAKVDEAVEIIRQLGVGTQLAKLDLQSAYIYRIVPIHPEDQHLLAIEWEGATYVDRALPFGLRSAPVFLSGGGYGGLGSALCWNPASAPLH